jgi:8-oxo-dGTP pyrophosphatase MutT (NUDIX family)
MRPAVRRADSDRRRLDLSGVYPPSAVALRRLIGRAALPDLAAAQAALRQFEPEFFRHFPALRGRFDFPSQLQPAAVLVPIIERAGGATVLLTYRTDDMPTHPGEIVFPGGGSKAEDTSLLATALREAQEEIGLEPAQVTVAGYLGARPMGARYRVQPVLGLVAPTARYRPCEREVAAIFEIPLSVVLDAAMYRRGYVDADYGALPDIVSLHYGEHHIWGATADILLDLCRRCGAVDAQ